MARGATDLEKPRDIGKFFFECGFRDLFDAQFRFVHDHDDRAVCTQEFDGIEPVVEAEGFFFFPP